MNVPRENKCQQYHHQVNLIVILFLIIQVAVAFDGNSVLPEVISSIDEYILLAKVWLLWAGTECTDATLEGNS